MIRPALINDKSINNESVIKVKQSPIKVTFKYSNNTSVSQPQVRTNIFNFTNTTQFTHR